MANVLVVGGAGYIGSHMMKALVKGGHDATAYDNLSTGHSDAVLYGNLTIGCLSDVSRLKSILIEGQFDAVMHFAANIEVQESVLNPRKYYENNVMNSLRLIHTMMDCAVSRLIFSSTAAIYGEPLRTPIKEDAAISPVNPYGRTKAMIEAALSDYRESYGFASTSLRYFNAAGADLERELGERHHPESHLIPLVIQTALGRRPHIDVYGDDHATPDGTCIRDYVHVSDLCSAHLLALEQLLGGAMGCSYNLGNGCGFSVREVIESVKKISRRNFPVNVVGKREGDPAVLVADASRATRELGWIPRFACIDEIVSSAWNFFSSER